LGLCHELLAQIQRILADTVQWFGVITYPAPTPSWLNEFVRNRLEIQVEQGDNTFDGKRAVTL
jgi:hypothetical protein